MPSGSDIPTELESQVGSIWESEKSFFQNNKFVEICSAVLNFRSLFIKTFEQAHHFIFRDRGKALNKKDLNLSQIKKNVILVWRNFENHHFLIQKEEIWK